MINLSESLDIVRVAIANMTSEERLALFHDLMYGYCEYCGRDDPKNKCQCCNDD